MSHEWFRIANGFCEQMPWVGKRDQQKDAGMASWTIMGRHITCEGNGTHAWDMGTPCVPPWDDEDERDVEANRLS